MISRGLKKQRREKKERIKVQTDKSEKLKAIF